MQFSEAGLARFPEVPQLLYHLGMAHCQLARAQLNATSGEALAEEWAAMNKFETRDAVVEEAYRRVANAEADLDVVSRAPAPRARAESPWLSVDEHTIAALESG